MVVVVSGAEGTGTAPVSALPHTQYPTPGTRNLLCARAPRYRGRAPAHRKTGSWITTTSAPSKDQGRRVLAPGQKQKVPMRSSIPCVHTRAQKQQAEQKRPTVVTASGPPKHSSRSWAKQKSQVETGKLCRQWHELGQAEAADNPGVRNNRGSKSARSRHNNMSFRPRPPWLLGNQADPRGS